MRWQSGLRGVGAATPRARARRPAVWEGDEHFSVCSRDGPAEMEERLRAYPGTGIRRTDRRRLLLGLERSREGRGAGADVQIGELAQALEQQEADFTRAARPGRRSGRATRPGSSRWVASTRRRASSTTTRASSSVPTSCGADDQFRGPTRAKQGHPGQAGRCCPVRPRCSEHLQGPPHPRHAWVAHLLDRPGDPGASSNLAATPLTSRPVRGRPW